MDSIRMDPYGDAKGRAMTMYQAAIMDAAKMFKEGKFEEARDTLNAATKTVYDLMKTEAIRRTAAEGRPWE